MHGYAVLLIVNILFYLEPFMCLYPKYTNAKINITASRIIKGAALKVVVPIVNVKLPSARKPKPIGIPIPTTASIMTTLKTLSITSIFYHPQRVNLYSCI